MPDPAKIKFIKENKEDVSKMVQRENVRRSRAQADPLSDAEIDEAVGEMMEIVDNGGRIRQFQFPEIKAPQLPHDQKIRDIASPTQHRIEKSVPRPQNTRQQATSFEVVSCKNGFILNIGKNGTVEPFVFKNAKELMRIFKNTLFVDLQKMQTQDKKNGSGAIQKSNEAKEDSPSPSSHAGANEQAGAGIFDHPASPAVGGGSKTLGV